MTFGPHADQKQRFAIRDRTLDAATMARLDEIFPGPGGEAPKACARHAGAAP
jgi:hypothetical protein